VTSGTRLARIAMFTLLGTGLVLLVVIMFGARLWHERDRYYIDVDGTVYGLERGGDVYYEGVPIGNIASIDIDRAQLGRVRVGILVSRGTPIRSDTRAYFLYAGVTGVKEIDLRGGSSAAPEVPVGGTIGIGESELDIIERQVASIAGHAERAFDNAERLTANLAAVTDRNQLGAAVASARDAADEFAAAAHALRSTIGDNRAQVSETIDALDRAAQHAAELLAGPADAVARRADDVVARLDTVVRTNADQLHTAISELGQAGRAVDELARQLRDSPSQLLFSRPPSRRRLP
jgi:phospholipid/cholesterol/gamma-HCH transport system substrate-binding protein